MSSWTPLMDKIVNSSIWDESDLVRIVWITMLAKKDCNQIVVGNAYEIGKWARKSEAEVLEALKVLSSPDKKRIEPQPFDGRRIQKVEGGYLILNGEAYEKMMREVSRRVYQRKWVREKRAAKAISKSGGSEQERQAVKTYADTGKFPDE